jgi:crossover junction endodeoxyribonuclease RusA
MSIHLTLPYPISANRYWATRVIKRKGAKFSTAMTYVTPEAERYKRDVRLIAATAGIYAPLSGRMALLVRLFPNRPQDWAKRARRDPGGWDDTVQCIDLGNCEKVLSDALNGVVWADDKQLRRIVLERMEPDERGARLEVAIEPVAAAPSLLDGLAA